MRQGGQLLRRPPSASPMINMPHSPAELLFTSHVHVRWYQVRPSCQMIRGNRDLDMVRIFRSFEWSTSSGCQGRDVRGRVRVQVGRFVELIDDGKSEKVARVVRVSVGPA